MVIRESVARESIFNLIHNQLGDVKNLLATGYDSGYLRHWTHELKLDSLLEEFLRD